MGLGSVLNTALSGMAAAETMLAVVANNLANSQTPGYKAVDPRLAASQPQTHSHGTAPNGSDGGSNPVQVGTGVTVAGMSTDFSQGSISIGGGSTSLAIEGQGMFILEGPDGQRSYTRDGTFQLNAARELVTTDGHRLLGFTADEDFQIETGQLSPLRIPLDQTVSTPSGETATMTGFQINDDGRIQGSFSDGNFRDLGQIQLANFANPSGLQRLGGNRYATGPNSGMPVASDPHTAGTGRLVSGATERSNTDIAESIIAAQLAPTLFSANLQVVDTAVSLLDELVHLRRPLR